MEIVGLDIECSLSVLSEYKDSFYLDLVDRLVIVIQTCYYNTVKPE